MKSIIEQLCKGEVEYVSLKLPKDRLEKEISYYDKIKALMTAKTPSSLMSTRIPSRSTMSS